MTARWSNPSGTIGVDRFKVWPADTDSYNHTDLTNNFDTLDGIIGQPSDASQWPPSTGLDGGIYKQIQLLILERAPIGSVVPFFRPALTVPIPTGWAAMDGSTILAADHDFPGINTDITLPDLRNATILGADATFTLGQAAVAVGNGNIDAAAGAPGGNATGGSNQTIQTEAQLAPHNHGGQTGVTGFDNQAVVIYQSQQNVLLGSITTEGGGEQGNHQHTIATDGSGSPMDNRQRWVGLVYIVKLKYITTI